MKQRQLLVTTSMPYDLLLSSFFCVTSLLIVNFLGELCFAQDTQPQAVTRNSDATSSSPQALQELLKQSRTTIFLGDSITASGQYVAMVEAWMLIQSWPHHPKIIDLGLPSETVSGLSEDGHAGGKFPRPNLHERLERVLKLTKPDLVFACYGMNCGIYQPLDAKRQQLYQQGIETLKSVVEASGAQLIVITPPFYDDLKKPLDGFSYNAVLDEYSKWLVSQRSKGWRVIDLHTAMTNEMLERRKEVADYSVQADGVHPNSEGHWCIAKQIINALGGNVGALSDPNQMLQAAELPREFLELVQKRTDLLRNAYVGAAGHLRPGVAAGLPVAEAEKQATDIGERLKEFVPVSKR